MEGRERGGREVEQSDGGGVHGLTWCDHHIPLITVSPPLLPEPCQDLPRHHCPCKGTSASADSADASMGATVVDSDSWLGSLAIFYAGSPFISYFFR